MTVSLSLAEARRLAITAQGLGARPARPTVRHLRALAARIHLFQIDSVNVLTRAHYVPAFARLGLYPRETLDTLAYRRRELFEYWGHAASLMPVSLYPLVRYRMYDEEARAFMRTERGSYVAHVYDEVAERGPLATADLPNPGQGTGTWWGWSSGKEALEYLYNAGLLAIAGRRGFERRYDLAERVIPRDALDAPAPPREEAMKTLICLGAEACGVGTLRDLTSYFKVDDWRDRTLPVLWSDLQTGAAPQKLRPIAKRLVAELVEEGRLVPVEVEGWRERAYMPPGITVPGPVGARALVTPFDSLVWERPRIARLFGMQYTIELYTPAPRRVYGYYVMPFLLGDTLVGRCDLKADRASGELLVQSAFVEPGQDARRVAPELAEELRLMQAWLELDRVTVTDRGDLAAALRRAVRRR